MRHALPLLLLAAALVHTAGAPTGKKTKQTKRRGGGAALPAAFASAKGGGGAGGARKLDAPALFDVAQRLTGAGRLLEPEAAYAAMLALPHNPPARVYAATTNLAGLQAQAMRFDEASWNWEQAVANAGTSGLAPATTIQARFNRARVLGLMVPPRLGEAEAALRAAIVIEPEMLTKFVNKKNDPTDVGGWLEKWNAGHVESRKAQRHATPNKPQDVLAPRNAVLATEQHWNVPCGELLYGSTISSASMYREIPGCTPKVCRRMVVDRFGSLEELGSLRALFGQSRFSDRSQIAREGVHAGMSIIALDAPTRAETVAAVGSEAAHDLLWELRGRMRDKIKAAFNLTSLFDSGALLQRQLPGYNHQPRPHIDKANVISYDYAGLWYLTSQGDDFDAGDLIFVDEGVDSVIQVSSTRNTHHSSSSRNFFVRCVFSADCWPFRGLLSWRELAINPHRKLDIQGRC